MPYQCPSCDQRARGSAMGDTVAGDLDEAAGIALQWVNLRQPEICGKTRLDGNDD